MSKQEIRLVRVAPAYAEKIADYRAEFPASRMRVTLNPNAIPGLDRLEEFESVEAWLRHCESMEGKIDWFLSVRATDEKVVGAAVLRRRLEYDDDDPEFCSHIGYSVRPSERRKGYAGEQLRLVLEKAKEAGLPGVRLICRAENTGSVKTILANGGVWLDTIHGEESGMNVNRYDITLCGEGENQPC